METVRVGAAAGGWAVEKVEGRAEELHVSSAALAGDAGPLERKLRLIAVDQPALVLGSTQPANGIDAGAAARAGVEVVRRRSGGGAVLVGPEEVVWVDFVIGKADPLWDADVGRAAWWVGEVWALALERAGFDRSGDVWRGAMRSSAWSRTVCFAGVGPGEVLVGPRKVVGVSQRRTRRGVLFQTAALIRWEPTGLVGLLALDPDARTGAAAELQEVAAGVGPTVAGRLEPALLSLLMP